MIQSIQRVKGFGVFDDFQWPAALQGFRQFTLIYGWNYSGKTTLSRVFRCFEQRQAHGDFAGAEAQLLAQDGTVHDLSAPHTAPEIRVFNSDFVRENLSFDVGIAAPILVLGKEDIEKQEALGASRVEREALALSNQSLRTTKVEKVSNIESGLTVYARDFIKHQLSEVNYDKRRFEPKVLECRSEPNKHLLDDSELAAQLSVCRSTDKKSAISPKVAALSSVTQLAERTARQIARIITANNPIPRLTQNPALEGWVNAGRSLHDDSSTCQFCGQSLPPDLMSQLTEHFSADYEDLMAELHALAGEIQAAQEQQVVLDHPVEFYPELTARITAENLHLTELLTARQRALATLADALNTKRAKAFTRLECPTVHDPDLEIAGAIEAINTAIAEHNSRTSQFEKTRKEAFVKIENHYAASFVRDQHYNETLQQIAELTTRISEQDSRLNGIDVEIRRLEKALSDASKGAERINELLAAYFGKAELRIEVSTDKRFQIVRTGVVAKNLSEGEKTAIAFAYFITRVQDGRHLLADIRVVVDDPISSLDANHLFNTYALVKTQFAGCRQLFVLTHSFEFYNLMREWVAEDEKNTTKPQVGWKKWGVFLLKRTAGGTAVLEEIPKELLKFRSEYHYLFSTMYHFDQAGDGKFDCLLGLPNVVRRFMEAFGGIMIPTSTGLKPKMSRLFPDEVERERVWKFINHYSHNTTITRSLTIPDTSECKAVVGACLKAVRDWNAEYFTVLESEVR